MFETTAWIAVNWIYILTVVFIIALVILENRSPVKTVAWIVVLILIPVVGIVFYIFFGQDYRKRKMFSRKGLKSPQRLHILQGKQLKMLRGETPGEQHSYSTHSAGLMKMLLNNNSSLVSEHNKLELLIDGVATFEALKAALKQAKHHIHLEFYILDDDELGQSIFDILIQKSLLGVAVRVLFDDVGSWELSNKTIRKMRKAGIHISSFQKVHFPFLSSRVNFRNHRKLAIIDGRIGFTGGLNIADRYLKGDPELGYWRDSFVRIEGEAVWSIQNIFVADWYFTTKENLSDTSLYPLMSQSGTCTVQVVSSGPDSDWPAIAQFYFAAIAQAQKYVYLTSPYFMPTDEILTALKTAALRGVDVRVLVPGNSDSFIPRFSTDSYIEEMLEANIKVYLYRNGFIHSKTLVVDDEISSIGSANMDFRSLETNFEINAVIYNREQALQMVETFNNDLKNSQELSYRAWRKRPFGKRLLASLMRLLSPLM
jgi:cardiolipin synthase A/B